LDTKNPFLSSMKDINDGGISLIDTKLPLKKVEVSKPVRAAIIMESFEKCCLDGGDKIEFSFRDLKTPFLVEGTDFCKGHFVKVKKVFMPYTLPDTFAKNGADPKNEEQTIENED
jgi:hypothetical protein